ncbi:MAG: hypothetical protein ABIQ99_09650 [Thermoflexales bacterium]
MNVYVHVNVRVRVRVHVHVYVYVYVDVYVYVYVHVHVHVYVYVYVDVYVYVHVNVRVHVHVYVYVRAYVNVYGMRNVDLLLWPVSSNNHRQVCRGSSADVAVGVGAFARRVAGKRAGVIPIANADNDDELLFRPGLVGPGTVGAGGEQDRWDEAGGYRLER